MNNQNIDVIIVPDFSSARASVFEIRTAYFLYTWIKNAGRAKEFPLHIACIGDPTQRIRDLAKKAGARITIHEPHPLSHLNPFLNKQVGLCVSGETDYHLLLDTDFWVISDFSEILKWGETIAAAPADHPRISTDYWLRIYESLDMSPPKEKIRPIRGEYNIPLAHKPYYHNQDQDVYEMFPYYQGGMVYAPWSFNLKTRWQENIMSIKDLFLDGDPNHPQHLAVVASDQAGLSITIRQLIDEGKKFTRIPPTYHANRVHLYANKLDVSDIKLYHATGFANSVRNPLLHYTKLLMHSMRNEWLLQHSEDSIKNYVQEYFGGHTRSIYTLIKNMHIARTHALKS